MVDRSRFNLARVNHRNWGAEIRAQQNAPPQYLTKLPKHIPIKSGIWEARAVARLIPPGVTTEIPVGVGCKLTRCKACGRYEVCEQNSMVLRCGKCSSAGVVK